MKNKYVNYYLFNILLSSLLVTDVNNVIYVIYCGGKIRVF